MQFQDSPIMRSRFGPTRLNGEECHGIGENRQLIWLAFDILECLKTKGPRTTALGSLVEDRSGQLGSDMKPSATFPAQYRGTVMVRIDLNQLAIMPHLCAVRFELLWHSRRGQPQRVCRSVLSTSAIVAALPISVTSHFCQRYRLDLTKRGPCR